MAIKRAILLLSGGIDSTTLLAKLSSENYDVVAISFNYGQKHKIELNYAKKNAEKYATYCLFYVTRMTCQFVAKLDRQVKSARD